MRVWVETNRRCELLPRLVDETWVIELDGAVAQLGEHLLCKQGVSGSIPLSSTICFVLTLSRSNDRCAPDGPRHEARRTIVLYGRIDLTAANCLLKK